MAELRSTTPNVATTSGLSEAVAAAQYNVRCPTGCNHEEIAGVRRLAATR